MMVHRGRKSGPSTTAENIILGFLMAVGIFGLSVGAWGIYDIISHLK